MRRAILRTAAAVVGVLAVACAPPHRWMMHDPGRDWQYTLDGAKQAVIAGRHADADRLLVEYAFRHPDAPQAATATYWRAVFLLDPANEGASLDTATALLDRYVAGPPTLPHWREAVILRRLAARLDTATRLAVAASTTAASTTRTAAGTSTAPADDRTKDEEIARLRAELGRANEELERIRRRLTAPRP